MLIFRGKFQNLEGNCTFQYIKTHKALENLEHPGKKTPFSSPAYSLDEWVGHEVYLSPKVTHNIYIYILLLFARVIIS